MPGALAFSIKNVSTKPIIFLAIDDLHNGHAGLDDVVLGNKAPLKPGATTNFEFSAATFATGVKEIRIDAIFYGDGSTYGDGPGKMQVESLLLGEALETGRDVGLLSASPDPNIAGLDNVAAQIGSGPVNNAADAAKTLRGVALPGISSAFILNEFVQNGSAISLGARRSRHVIMSAISNVRMNDANQMAGDTQAQQVERTRRSHALSDLAARMSAVYEWQIEYLTKLVDGGGQ